MKTNPRSDNVVCTRPAVRAQTPLEQAWDDLTQPREEWPDEEAPREPEPLPLRSMPARAAMLVEA